MTTSRFALLTPLVLILAWGIGSNTAEATTRTWNGASITSNAWTDPSNWTGGTAPSPNDDLVFPAGTLQTATFNDFTAGTSFHSIAFGDAYTVDGNAVSVVAGVQVTVASPGTVSLNLAIGGTGGVTKNGSGDLILAGNNTYAGITETFAGRILALSNTALGLADGTMPNGTHLFGGANLVLNGVAIGNEAIALNSAYSPTLTPTLLQAVGSPSSVAGPILIGPTGSLDAAGTTLTVTGPITGSIMGVGTTGTVVLANGSNQWGNIDLSYLGTQPTTLVLTNDHALPAYTVLDLPAGKTLRVNSAIATITGLTGAGTVDLPGFSSYLELTGSPTTPSTTFTGTITGANGSLTQRGDGHLTLVTNSPAFTGSLGLLDNATLTLNGTTPAEALVNGNGRLQLAGGSAVGTISANPTGHVELQGNVTVTTKTGRQYALTLSPDATLDVIGTAPATLPTLTAAGYAYQNQRVFLAYATLNLQLPSGFDPPAGTVFTLIHNESGGGLNYSTFKNLPEGSVLTVNGIKFGISYVGGTEHNDVTLTVIPPPREYLLSEGATSGFFTTDLLLANPNDAAAAIAITFLKDDGTTVTSDDVLGAKSQKMIRVNGVQGMEATNFSTIVRSKDGLPLAVERTMSWDRSGYGAHTEHATDGPGLTWYFAEGSQGFFHTYLLLANPQTSANRATVQYLREGEAPLTRTYDLTPTSRRTVDAGNDGQLANRSFGMIVTFDQPGAAERAMYFGDAPLFNGGHESAGVPQPSTTWFLAEGATGPFFETFLLMANPNATPADATLTYLPAAGPPITKVKSIPANGRITVNLEPEDPALANAAVSTQVVASLPILVERSQYWPDPAPQWYEAHNSFGVTALGTRWALAEGRVGDVDSFTGAQTYVLLANPNTTAAQVTITFLRDNGGAPVTKQFTVQPTSRFNVAIGSGSDVPELANEHFGALVVSDQPIAVERAVYWNANTQIWAAGTNATATRLP